MPRLTEKELLTIHVELDAHHSDERLPPSGSVLNRPDNGGVVQVRLLPDGFEYEGAVYTSLCAVARQFIGSHCNGYLFFRNNSKLGGSSMQGSIRCAGRQHSDSSPERHLYPKVA